MSFFHTLKTKILPISIFFSTGTYLAKSQYVKHQFDHPVIKNVEKNIENNIEVIKIIGYPAELKPSFSSSYS